MNVCNHLCNMRYYLFGVPSLNIQGDRARIASLTFDVVSPDALELALRKSEHCLDLDLGYAYVGYGCIVSSTPEQEDVIITALEERTKPLRSLYLMQNRVSEAGMQAIISALAQNPHLELQSLVITHESVYPSTKVALLQLLKNHPNIEVTIREFGTARDPGDGNGYNEKFSG